jgi:hypothetical protein
LQSKAIIKSCQQTLIFFSNHCLAGAAEGAENRAWQAFIFCPDRTSFRCADSFLATTV